MVSTLMSSTPVIDWSSFVAAEHSAHTAPNASLQGTGLPFAGTYVAVAAPASALTAQGAFRVRTTDLPGLVPRGAPV